VAVLTDYVNNLSGRVVAPTDDGTQASTDISATTAPVRSRRFTRTGTIKGEESLNDLLQGAKPPSASPNDPAPVAPAATDSTGTPPDDAPPSAPPAKPARRLGPMMTVASHNRRMKLVIFGSQFLSFTLLVLGVGLGWLIFAEDSSSERPGGTNRAAHADEKRNTADPYAIMGASDHAIQAAESALKAERAGDFSSADKLYDEIRQQQMILPGLYYQAGITAARGGDLPKSDLALLHSVQEGEQVAASYYFRATWAGSRGDYTSAADSFQAAARGEPFSARPFFFWAECLRRKGQPTAALVRFDQALLRSCTDADAEYIRFKHNLALVEIGNDLKFQMELADKLARPNVTGDSVLLAAANDLTTGAFTAGADHLRQASKLLSPEEYSVKVADYLFQSQSRRKELTPLLTTANLPSVAAAPLKPGEFGPPAPEKPFVDPAVQRIQEADPAAWPAPRILVGP
jgi:tetratricopeptide (TPR) repeat protein